MPKPYFTPQRILLNTVGELGAISEDFNRIFLYRIGPWPFIGALYDRIGSMDAEVATANVSAVGANLAERQDTSRDCRQPEPTQGPPLCAHQLTVAAGNVVMPLGPGRLAIFLAKHWHTLAA